MNISTDPTPLKSSYKVENKFHSTAESLYGYVVRLFHDYIDARIGSKDQSDKYKASNQLIIDFRNDFYSAMTTLKTDIEKMIDLDAIFNEIQSKDINKSIITEMKTVVVSVLKQVVREKITAQVKNKLSVVSIKFQIDKLKTADLTDSETEKIVTDALKTSNKAFEDAQKEFGTSIQTYRDTLFSMFKKQISKDADRRKYLEDKQKKSKYNQIFDKFNPSRKLDDYTVKRINQLCDRLFILINYSFGKKVVLMVKKAVKLLLAAPFKIIKAVGKFVKNLVKAIVTKTLQFVNSFILTPIRFILSTSFKIIGTLTKGIYKSVKFILKKTKAHFLLFTPPGMYALGFLIGYIWTKMKQKMPDLTFSIDGMIKFFRHIFEMASDFYFSVKDSIEQFLNDHPKLYEAIIDTRNKVARFISDIRDKGFFGAIQNTETYAKATNFFNAVKGNWLFKTVINGLVLLKDIYVWILENPILSGLIYSGGWITQKVLALRQIMSMVKIPLKGNFLQGLLGAGISLGTQSATEGIIGMFNGEADMENASWKLGESKSSLSDALSNSWKNQKVFDEIQDPKIKQKYGVVSNFITEEHGVINDLNRDLEMIKDLHQFQGKFDTDIVHGDLGSILPDFIMSAFRGATKPTKDEYEKAVKSKNVEDQIKAITKAITEKINTIASYQQTLNSANSANISDILNDMVDDNMNIVDNRSSEYIRHLRYLTDFNGTASQLNTTLYQTRYFISTASHLSQAEKMSLRLAAINLVKKNQADWIKDEIIYDVLQRHSSNGGVLDINELRKMEMNHDDYKESIWDFGFKRDVLLKGTLKAILGTDVADSVKEEEIRQMIEYGNRNQIKQIYDLANSIKDLKDIPLETKEKLLALREEIKENRKREVNAETLEHTEQLKEYALSADYVISEYTLSCSEEINKCKELKDSKGIRLIDDDQLFEYEQKLNDINKG